MQGTLQVDEKLIQAFHLMFDHYPEPAQLTHKSKQVVAVNPAAKANGREIGAICSQHGPAEAHKDCLANQAVEEQQAKWLYRNPTSSDQQKPLILWVPIAGYPDFFLHLAAGVNTKA